MFPLGPQHVPFKMIWTTATALLGGLGHRVSIIIDALDECSFERRNPSAVSSLLGDLVGALRITNSKLVILSRPEAIFSTVAANSLSIQLTEDLLVSDIETFARREFEQLQLPNSYREKILQHVRQSCHGSFRWTEMVLDYLGQSLQMKDFETRLNTLPPSIEALYRQSLLDSAQQLDGSELQCRNELLSSIFRAQRPLKTTEIADAFKLRPEKAEAIICDLCKPLASSYCGFLQFTHPSVREFFDVHASTNDLSLGLSLADAHGLLAEKCLSCLLEEQYASLDRIGTYLLANTTATTTVGVDAKPSDGCFYDYASRFWDFHLVRATKPTVKLIQQANDFLMSLHFSYWSEYTRLDCGQLVRVCGAFGSLKSWHKRLPSQDQALAHLEGYFNSPYRLLSSAFESRYGNSVCVWLAKMGEGEYYFNMAMTKEAGTLREEVFPALKELLGPLHALTLRAKAEFACSKMFRGDMRAARELYTSVADVQLSMHGENSLQYLETLIWKGQSEYYMTDFASAATTWAMTLAGFLKVVGPDRWQYLATQMWYARCLSYMGQLDLALELLQSVVQRRRELFGPGDTFANFVHLNVAEVQLLLRHNQEAVTTIQDLIAWRRETYPIANNVRLDAEIALSFAYQAIGMHEAALSILQEIEQVVDLNDRFHQGCQITHIKGIILAKQGSRNQAINLLQEKVIQTKEDQNNRALLWICLDLATLLRSRGADGDEDQASANFDNLVKDVSDKSQPSIPGEPDPPRLLAVAERALRLLRVRRQAEARKVLDEEAVDWCRPSDLWLWTGGSFCRDAIQMNAT